MAGTTDTRVLHNRARAFEYAAIGAQADLIIIEAPAGATSLIGTAVKDATITVDGDYVCLLPIAGLASVRVRVLPQLTTMTLSSSGPDALALAYNPRTTDPSDGEVIIAGAADGALSDDTLQTATLANLGAKYAIFTLTAADAAGSITFDVAEYGGE